MSCRVFLPDDPPHSNPVPWKQVPRTVPAGGVRTVPAESEPDLQLEMARLEQDCERRVREAYAAGMQEGETAGRTRAAAEFQPVVERFAQTIAELSQMRARLRREAEGDTIRLALAIARRILRRELAVDPDALEGLLIGALEKLQGQELSRIRVHPSHAALVRAQLETLRASASVEIVSDASRPPGTAIFETGRGNLDASVEAQLEEIERGLTDRLHHGHGE